MLRKRLDAAAAVTALLRMIKYPGAYLGRLMLAVPLARADGKKENKEKEKAVIAVFTFDGPVLEKPQGEEFPLFASIGRGSLKELLERMKKAKDDKNVKAVVFLLDEVDLGLSQVEEIAEAVRAIKKSGKEVLVHVDSALMMQGLAPGAAASRISVTPTAIILIPGYNSECAVPPPPVGQDWCNARLSHLRRVQDRGGNVHALGPERRGGPHEKLAVGQSL